MGKKLRAISVFLVLMISACGTRAEVETVMPTLTETQTPTATKSPTVTETPSATLTPQTPIPTNSPNCTNSAAFVADVTIPDNSSVSAGAAFTKTWSIRNTGTCIWGPDYKLTHYSDESMLAPPSVALSLTFPGQTADISIDLIAPQSDGTHRGFFAIKNPAGLIMKIDNDSRLWVVINVAAEMADGLTATLSSGTNQCAYTTDTAKVTEIIQAVNEYRSQNGLTAYLVNELLNTAAAAHANDMACNKLISHIGSNGLTPSLRVAASGYTASSVTENVYGSDPPFSGLDAVNWWKNDVSDFHHNQNLLSTKYTEIGVGYSFYNNFGVYVLVFAAP